MTLGLLPGLGGTQRLPRLIGVKAAVNATLKDKKMKSKEALKLGLLDAVVAPGNFRLSSAKKLAYKKLSHVLSHLGDLMKSAAKLALDIASGKVTRRRSLFLTDKIRSVEDETIEVEKARVEILCVLFVIHQSTNVSIYQSINLTTSTSTTHIFLILPFPTVFRSVLPRNTKM